MLICVLRQIALQSGCNQLTKRQFISPISNISKSINDEWIGRGRGRRGGAVSSRISPPIAKRQCALHTKYLNVFLSKVPISLIHFITPFLYIFATQHGNDIARQSLSSVDPSPPPSLRAAWACAPSVSVCRLRQRRARAQGVPSTMDEVLTSFSSRIISSADSEYTTNHHIPSK